MFPMLIHIKIHNAPVRLGLWLPLFLIWILLLPIAVILIPLLLIAEIVLTATNTGISPIRIFAAVLTLFSQMRGLHVTVNNKNRNEHVLVSIH